MKIFITGANGNLGGELSFYLLKKKFQLEIITTNKNKIFKKFKNYLNLINVSNYRELKSNKFKINNKKDIFFHLAGTTSKFINSRHKLNSANVISTQEVLNFCIKKKISKIFLLSSLSVYSHIDKSVINIKSTKKPNSAYGISKLKAENLAQKICNKHRISLTIIRIPSVYGNRTSGKSKFLRNLIKFSIPLPIKGINLKRSYLDINYFNNSIFRLIQKKKKMPELIIADQNDLTLNELVNKLNFSKKKIYRFNLIKFFPNFIKNYFFELESIKKLIINKNDKF
jgi:nucleoside-diphosphate-sugar epimerase